MAHTEHETNLMRRRLILGGACALLFSQSTVSEQPDINQLEFPDVNPSQLGISVNLESGKGFGYPTEKSLEDHFLLPLRRLRVGFRFETINPSDGVYDFRETDKIVDGVIKHNKTLEVVMGMKTPGHPEVRVPKYLIEKFPYLLQPGPLDREKEVRDKAMEYLDRTWERYRNVREIKRVHIDNEGLLIAGINNWRYVTDQFYEEQVNHVQSKDPYNRDNVQNPPWHKKRDTLALMHNPLVDIVALNIYNNAGDNKYLWEGISLIKSK
jgi:hypothetical protein